MNKLLVLLLQNVVFHCVLNKDLQGEGRYLASKHRCGQVHFKRELLLKSYSQQVIIGLHKIDFFLNGHITAALR